MPVYVIQAVNGGPCKIGRTADLAARFAAIQAASPLKLVVRAEFKGGSTLEARLHAEFSKHRLHGEWFDVEPDAIVVAANRPAEPAPVVEISGNSALKAHLKRNGLTLVEFAQAIGSTHPTVSRLINGRRKPSIAMVARIDAATGGAVTARDWYAVEKAKADGEAA